MEPKQYLTELESALEQYRFGEVRALTDQIDPATFDLPQIKKALRLIRRKRLFADLEHAASLFSMAGKENPLHSATMVPVVARPRTRSAGIGRLEFNVSKILR